MRLGLLGYPIQHSRSPELYHELLDKELSSYSLFPFQRKGDIPTLDFFASRLDGLSITSPYKEHFFSEVQVESKLIRSLGAINTISLSEEGYFGTNTDLLAVQHILDELRRKHGELNVLLLGDGVMARLTRMVCAEMKLEIHQYTRKQHGPINTLDLSQSSPKTHQTLIINACSRDFVFEGKTCGDEIFWDFNYSFLPHQKTLPFQVKTYLDGQEMLLLQAKAAINFWRQHNPKLK
jgi:shikimate dehydrogenase